VQVCTNSQKITMQPSPIYCKTAKCAQSRLVLGKGHCPACLQEFNNPSVIPGKRLRKEPSYNHFQMVRVSTPFTPPKNIQKMVDHARNRPAFKELVKKAQIADDADVQRKADQAAEIAANKKEKADKEAAASNAEAEASSYEFAPLHTPSPDPRGYDPDFSGASQATSPLRLPSPVNNFTRMPDNPLPPPPFVLSQVLTVPTVVGVPHVQPAQRSVSTRTGKDGKPLSQKQLVTLVKDLNAQLPKQMKHKNIGSMTVPSLDAIMDQSDQYLALASLQTQHAGAVHRMTQPVCRTICIRILTLLACDSDLLDSYRDSLGKTARLQVEGGNDSTVHAGTGMGLNHEYHRKLNLAFNDASNCSDFPFEYFPGRERTYHARIYSQ